MSQAEGPFFSRCGVKRVRACMRGSCAQEGAVFGLRVLRQQCEGLFS
jgi:hypothetical protein